jgi:putative nucleotidyltransferase with HDIG domain
MVFEADNPQQETDPQGGGAAVGLALNDKRRELILKRVREIPSLPEVVNKIIQLLGQPHTSAAEISKLISYDPGLTSRVLRMVNSASYGIQRQITSIQHAIMILGFNTVRGLVLSASIFKLFAGGKKSGLFDPMAYWRHSMLTAMLGRLVCKAYALPEGDEAFSAGMLHDIGKLVLHEHFTADYNLVQRLALEHHCLPHGERFLLLERQGVGTNHSDIGAQLAVKWKLPATLTEVIQHHHHPERAVLNANLTYVVALANKLSVFVEQAYDLDTMLEHLPENLKDYFSLNATEDLAFLAPHIEPSLAEVDQLLQQFSKQAES